MKNTRSLQKQLQTIPAERFNRRRAGWATMTQPHCMAKRDVGDLFQTRRKPLYAKARTRIHSIIARRTTTAQNVRLTIRSCRAANCTASSYGMRENDTIE